MNELNISLGGEWNKNLKRWVYPKTTEGMISGMKKNSFGLILFKDNFEPKK